MVWRTGDILPDVHDALKRMRDKMDRGEYREASWEIVNELKEKGYQTRLESPLPLADVKIEIDPKQGFQEYKRALNMETGEASCQWTDSGVLYRCDGFVLQSRRCCRIPDPCTETCNKRQLRAEFHRNPGTELPEISREMEKKAKAEAVDAV